MLVSHRHHWHLTLLPFLSAKSAFFAGKTHLGHTHINMCNYVHAQVVKMANMTISVPDELKKLLDKYPELNWSEVARQAWRQKAEQLELLNRLTANSKATDKDVMEIAEKVKLGMAKWHEEQWKKRKG